MNLTRIFLAVCLAAFSVVVSAASEPAVQRERLEKFQQLANDGDTTGARELLRTWSAESPTDVELAVAWANYYMSEATTTGVTIEAGQSSSGRAPFTILDKDTGEQVGFIEMQRRYDPALLSRATSVLRDAITTHPQRTDIWMGATHAYLLGLDYDRALDTLTSFTGYTKKNPDKLTMAYGAPLDERADFFVPRVLHSYAVQGYEDETTAGRTFLLNVARLAQKEYPKHPYAYNDEAVYYNYLENDEKVLESLLRAHKVRPDDGLITFNIASTYRNLKRPEKMREYLELTIKIADDEELKNTARQILEAQKSSEKK